MVWSCPFNTFSVAAVFDVLLQDVAGMEPGAALEGRMHRLSRSLGLTVAFDQLCIKLFRNLNQQKNIFPAS